MDTTSSGSTISAAGAGRRKKGGQVSTNIEDKQDKRLTAPDYTLCPSGAPEHAVSLIIGFAAGFAVSYIFYRIVMISIVCGAVFGAVNIFSAAQNAVSKRSVKLRIQFFDLLEAVSVAMRAGSPLLKALQSAREDLLLIYSEESDIIIELDIIIGKFNNAMPLSEAFYDFAERSKLEDIVSFASVYATIEGKSGRTDEIIRETQQIISDKMEIEMEIATLLTAAKTEANVMLFMPIVILAVIGYSGAGFMDTIYTTPAGRIVSTVGLIIYIISYFMARKFSNVVL